MTQPIGEKCEALRSLLPFVHAHLDRRTTQTYGDSEGDPGPVRSQASIAADLDCDGRCDVCPFGKVCQGEGWERTKRFWMRYRMTAITASYELLGERRPWLQVAVRAVYADPYEGRVPDADSKSEPVSEAAKIMRRRVAEDGVEWMAREIPGELVAFGERPLSEEEKRRRTRERIKAMLRAGCSYEEIQQRLRCSSKTIAAVSTSMRPLVASNVRCGC